MKNMLLNQLIVSGATQKLKELNKEREYLIKVIDRYSSVKIRRLKVKVKSPKIRATAKGKSYNGKHWTQLPENKGKMLRLVKKMKKGRTK